MGKRALFAIVVCLLFGLALGGVFLYKYASDEPVQISQATLSVEQNLTQSPQKSGSWVDNLAAVSKKEYILPVNEIFIEYVQPKKEPPRTIAYELVIDKNDIYSLFCLMQTLRGTAVDFTVVKDGTKSQIFLNTQDSQLLQNIIIKLRTYDIHSSVREVRL